MDSLNLGELLNVRGRGSDNNRNAILNRLGAHLPVTGGGSSSSQQDGNEQGSLTSVLRARVGSDHESTDSDDKEAHGKRNGRFSRKKKGLIEQGKRKEQNVVRMRGLIKRIQEGNGSGSSSSGLNGKRKKTSTSVETAPPLPVEQATKVKKVYLRYQRFRNELGKYVTVGKANEGGIRTVDVEVGREFKLRDLLKLATEVYFTPNNYFGETPNTCLLSLFNGIFTSQELDRNEDLFKFMKRKHLLFGKTDFILKSIVEDDTELDDPTRQLQSGGSTSMGNEAEEPENAITPRITSTGRPICPKCGQSLDPGTSLENCFRCLQNQEYEATLSSDQGRQLAEEVEAEENGDGSVERIQTDGAPQDTPTAPQDTPTAPQDTPTAPQDKPTVRQMVTGGRQMVTRDQVRQQRLRTLGVGCGSVATGVVAEGSRDMASVGGRGDVVTGGGEGVADSAADDRDGPADLDAGTRDGGVGGVDGSAVVRVRDANADGRDGDDGVREGDSRDGGDAGNSDEVAVSEDAQLLGTGGAANEDYVATEEMSGGEYVWEEAEWGEPPKVIRVKRTRVVEDMMEAFKDVQLEQQLNFKFIDQLGREERGVGIGLAREAYASFWCGTYRSRFSGVAGKVPQLATHMHRDEWEVVGRILLKGFKDTSYFPVGISRAFMEQVIHGGEPSDQLLVESLLEMSSTDERNALRRLKEGVDNEDGEGDDDQDVLDDFLQHYKCTSLVTPSNIQDVLLQIARKEIIQKPFFIIDCWRTLVLSCSSPLEFDLEALYSTAIPTSAKVIKMIKCVTLTEPEQKILRYFKKFIRDISQGKLLRLMQWMTGSDLLLTTVTEIKVMFIEHDAKGSNFTRAPVARTCGPCVELPNSYMNHTELSRELMEIISSQPTWWDFDIS